MPRMKRTASFSLAAAAFSRLGVSVCLSPWSVCFLLSSAFGCLAV